MEVYSLLRVGEQNATTRRELMRQTGLNDRELRRKIAAERKAGSLILSTTDGSGGYYRPANAAELRRFIASMTARGRKTFAAINAAKKALLEIDNGGGE